MKSIKDMEQKTISAEFTERVCSLLLTFIDGFRSQISSANPLNSKLEKMSVVVKKALSLNKTTDLGRDIKEFFREKTIEEDFREVEKEETKHIVLSMANAIKEVISGVGDFGNNLEECIGSIEATNNLDEILAIKNQIISITQTAVSKNQSLKKELEVSQQTVNKLSKKLDETESKSLIDPLTKVLNRGAYNMKVGQVIRDIQKHQGSTALIVADLDFFKKFNDDYGHKTGDRILQSVASTIQDSLRPTDLVFRYGGEEFVVMLYKSSLEQAEKDADKIRNQVKKDFFLDKDKELKVTLSLGVTCLKEDDTEESFFERADQALFMAKRTGRDQVKKAE
jgi:diguanylate cyclase